MTHMKKIIISFFFITIFQIAQSQVVLNLQIPLAGVQLKSQLWNFSIINSGTLNINVKIEMVFTDAINGQRIFTATSRIINLTQQITQLQLPDVSPIDYTIINSSYNIDINPNGFLPVGHFNVCVAVMKINNENIDLIAEECETIEVEPASPPILVTPGDEEILDIVRPFFTWLPPTPINSFNNLTYDWILKEIQENQNPSDAIQQNIPIHSEENLNGNYLLYPSSLPELDTSKTYVWQVAAKSSNNAISKSEIWTFRVRKYGLDTLISASGDYYAPLTRQNNASYATFNDVIRYVYLNELNDSMAKINIYDLTSTSRNAITPPTAMVNLRFGENYLKTIVDDLPGIIDKHIYLLELINSKQEKWFLKFEYRKA